MAMVALAPVVVNIPVIVRAANQTDSYLTWAIFGSVAVCSVTTLPMLSRPAGSGPDMYSSWVPRLSSPQFASRP